MTQALVRGRPITCLEDLAGLTVEVLEANDVVLVLRLPDGRVVKVWADYGCVYDDCSGPEDPWPYLDVKEVSQ